MNVTKRCEVCETALEFEQDGLRVKFARHDDAFCAGATRALIQSLRTALERSAKDRAEEIGGLLFRLARSDVEIEMLEDALREMSLAAPLPMSLPQHLQRGSPEWERRVEKELERKRHEAEARIIEMQPRHSSRDRDDAALRAARPARRG